MVVASATVLASATMPVVGTYLEPWYTARERYHWQFSAAPGCSGSGVQLLFGDVNGDGVLTNDEVSTRIVPSFVAPTLSKGEGVDLRWWISCGGSVVNGTLPWKSIQTVVVRC